MNERIRELREQAAKFAEVTYDNYTMATFNTNKSIETLFEEKFAELIVQECCSAIRLDDAFNGGKFQRTILEHFGVEE
jgi:hypothetical protein